MPDLVTAVWNGPFPGERPDGSTLNPGDEAQVSKADLESGHWVRKGAKAAAPDKHSHGGDS